MNDMYNGTIEDFMKNNPEIDPSLKEMIEPLFKETEYAVLNFFLGAFLKSA